MVKSIHIKNYRNIKDLKLDNFAQVNFITGKNNTGKTSILEALALYVDNANPRTLKDILANRGEYISRHPDLREVEKVNIKTLSSLFPNREFSATTDNQILLKGDDKLIRLYFVLDGDRDFSPSFFIDKSEKDKENKTLNFPLNRNRLFPMLINQLSTDVNFQYVQTRNIDREVNSFLFDKITMSEKEENVIEALKIIEPNIERIAFVGEEYSRERNAVVRIKGRDTTFPLSSMGDGINRILTIILAMVNCSDGYLFIDEFETGLHYTAQEELMKVIFKLAERLNIQVFATTHSEDTISTFARALNQKENKVSGSLMRLDYKDEMIKVVSYDKEELLIADKSNIEVR